jgi:hypothetical protein
MIARSALVMSPQAKSTQVQERPTGWGKVWGTVQWIDPAGGSEYNWYRTGGQDTQVGIFERTIGPLNRSNRSAQDPFRDETVIHIAEMKGAWPHLTADESAYLAANWGSVILEGVGQFMCPVIMDGKFAFYLFRDASAGTCNPGGWICMYTKSAEPNEIHVESPTAYFLNDELLASTTAASGQKQVELEMPWIPTAPDGSTGFYLDTSFMHEGGILSFGPTATTESGVGIVASILSETSVELQEPLQINITPGTPVRYFESQQNSGTFFKAEGPVGTGAPGQMPVESVVRVNLNSNKTGITTIEEFVPIPWAIPAPYSIRNTPFTNIWMRLGTPSIPFNLDTLVFKVNGVEITDRIVVATTQPLVPGQLQIVTFVGGVELYYDPPEDFELNSRVSVSLHVSCSPSHYVELDNPLLPDGRYVSISESSGSTDAWQAGGTLVFGPNPLGQMEEQVLLEVVDGTTIISTPRINEYVAGDFLRYTYDDYSVDVDYWFEIVNDYKPPRFEIIYPANGAEDVDIWQWLQFDVKDDGLGIDISTLTFTVNNIVVIPQITRFDEGWYRVTYYPVTPFYFNANVECFATCMDKSTARNRSYAVWGFRTREAELPFLMNQDPGACSYPVHLKDDIRVDLYAREGGANLDSLIFTVAQKRYEVKTYPKLYRYQ